MYPSELHSPFLPLISNKESVIPEVKPEISYLRTGLIALWRRWWLLLHILCALKLSFSLALDFQVSEIK